RRDRRRRDRLDTLGADHRQTLRHLVGEQAPPWPLAQLSPQRQIGERVERVVEIDHEFAPLHTVDIVGRAHLQTWYRQLLRGARLVLLDDDIAGRRAMKSPVAERD